MTHLLRKNSQIPAYMAYPRFLLTMDISETAKLVYVLLLDRARLSMKNDGWEDEQGHVFIYYTIEALAEASGKSEMTVKNALAALERQGLISRKRQGAGLPSKIYVKVQTESCPTEGTSFKSQTDKKLSTSNKQSKSFIAGCIANALLDEGVPVMMTNFARLLNKLTDMYSGDRNTMHPNLRVDLPQDEHCRDRLHPIPGLPPVPIRFAFWGSFPTPHEHPAGRPGQRMCQQNYLPVLPSFRR